MRRFDKTYRLVKIGKIAASVAVCGFLFAPVAANAYTYNLTSGATLPTLSGTDSEVYVYYNTGGGGNSIYINDVIDDAININLASGFEITGNAPTGGIILAVYTRDTADSSAIDYVDFISSNSSLTLQGDNSIRGVVGAHINYNSNDVLPDPFDLITINGTDVVFNGQVFADDIDITQAGTVTFNDGVGGRIGTSSSYSTNVDLNANAAEVTFGTGSDLVGNIYSTNTSTNDSSVGGVRFSGTSTISGSMGTGSDSLSFVEVNGNNTHTVHITGSVYTDKLTYSAATNVDVDGSIDLVNAATTSSLISMGSYGGSLTVAGNIVGESDQIVISSLNDSGRVYLNGDTQTVTGHVGSANSSLAILQIGKDSQESIVTVDGDIFAPTTLKSDGDSSDGRVGSTLILGSGYDLTGALTTTEDSTGTFTLEGGDQTVTGNIGTSTVRLETINAAANVVSEDPDTSTFDGLVYADSINVGDGIANFNHTVGSTTINIAAGEANFDVTDGTTTANIEFTDVGTANLNAGLTGDVDFNNNAAEVNLALDQQIDGSLFATGATNGTASGSTLNLAGADVWETSIETVTGTISGVDVININYLDSNNNETVDVASASKTPYSVLLGGNTSANTINVMNGSNLRIADDVNLTGSILSVKDLTDQTAATEGTVTGDFFTDNQLEFLGSSVVTGNVGEADSMFDTIKGGATSEVVSFNGGTVYAETLLFTGTGDIEINGFTSVDIDSSADVTNNINLGFVGTVDLANKSGADFRLGDNVELVTQNYDMGDSTVNAVTTFKNANSSNLWFDGSSDIYGVLGSDGSEGSDTTQTFADIYAGTNSDTVTFHNDVYIYSPTTFHVTGNGVVNFMGNLNGSLVFENNGSVNVADKMAILGNVTTDNDSQGSLSFVGSANLSDYTVGTKDGNWLLAVNFHASTSDSNVMPVIAEDVTINLGSNIYADTVTIGTTQNSNADLTVANLTANVDLGGALVLAGPSVTLNTSADVNSNTLSYIKNPADGTLAPAYDPSDLSSYDVFTATITGALTTNDATLNFAVANNGLGGEVNSTASSGIVADSLVLNGSEMINVHLLGSLRNGESYTLVETLGEDDTSVADTLLTAASITDSSYVINSSVVQRDVGNNEDLVITFTRENDEYIDKSNTVGLFSNTAATRLGTLAAAGSDYTADFQKALNMLDVDEWGYGDSEENLAEQMKWLAPIANNSLNLSAFQTASVVNDSLGQRMHELRLPEPGTNPAGWWVGSAFDIGQTDQIGDYNGYDSNVSAATIGVDKRLSDDSILGAAVSFSNTSVDQDGYRNGDEAGITGTHLSLYGAFDVTPEFFVGATLTGAQLDTDSNRSTIVGRIANASYDSTQVTGKIDLGYRIKLGNSNVTLTPLAHYEHSTLKQDAYTETGAGDVGYNVEAETFKRNEAGLGFRLAGVGSMGGVVVKPELTLLSTTIGGNFSQDVRTSFIGDNTTSADFVTTALDENSYDSQGYKATLGMGLLMSDTSSIDFRVEHSEYDDRTNSQIDLKARWEF